MSGENIEKLKKQSQGMDLATINSSILTLANTINDARYSTQARTLMELAIVVLANGIKDEGKAPAAFIENAASVPMTKSGRQVKDRAAAQEIRQAARESKTENPEPVASQSEPVQDVASGSAGASYDMDELWERVWERLPEHGSISMVRMNTSLAGVNEREFKVIACSDFVRDLAEKNTEIITKAVADEVGRPLKMVLRSANDAGDLEETSVDSVSSGKDEEAKKIAEALESSFNIKPRIE